MMWDKLAFNRAVTREPDRKDLPMKHVITLGCLTGAVVMYILGLESGAAILFAAGILFEVAFWKRVLNLRKK
ncbi:hypothetical protein [Collimonas sp. PA-H2]|uniref:hypothetical protein n=1 Tax=Collimonas sp. PA-H2 TaxID=1881062 RepID=UPI000BF98B8E|nr:hypothetical protein [Collimonas sp. PA-H2]